MRKFREKHAENLGQYGKKRVKKNSHGRGSEPKGLYGECLSENISLRE